MAPLTATAPQPVSKPTTLVRTDGSTEVAQVPETIQAQTVTPVADAVAAATGFTDNAAPAVEISAGERYLPTSATPESLWGEAKTSLREFDPRAFSRLTKDAQRAAVEELKAQRHELRGRIQARVGQLHERWRGSPVATRMHALRDYHRHSRRLDEPTRGQLDQELVKAEGAQEKISQRTQAIEQVSIAPESAVERELMVAMLLTARVEQSTAVEAATGVVESKGLQTDLLAHSEQAIDPNAPPQGSGNTLLEKVADFLHLDHLFDTVSTFVTNFWKTEVERYNDKKKEEAEDQKRSDRIAQELQKRLEQARRIEEDLAAYVEKLRALSPSRQAAATPNA